MIDGSPYIIRIIYILYVSYISYSTLRGHVANHQNPRRKYQYMVIISVQIQIKPKSQFEFAPLEILTSLSFSICCILGA